MILNPSPTKCESLGFALYLASRYDEALQRFRETAELDPSPKETVLPRNEAQAAQRGFPTLGTLVALFRLDANTPPPDCGDGWRDPISDVIPNSC